jgi:hypothetical protein
VPSGRNIALLQELLAEPGREMLYANSNRPLLLSEGASMSRLDASQAAAKLSVYLGLGAEPRRSLRTSQRNGARALVYDLRTWTEEGLYGPLKADGTVDWRKAEAICFVACNNARDLTRSLGALGRTRLPCQLAGARPMSAPGWNSDEVPGDWAGVTGHWRRCINFCDWVRPFVCVSVPRLNARPERPAAVSVRRATWRGFALLCESVRDLADASRLSFRHPPAQLQRRSGPTP